MNDLSLATVVSARADLLATELSATERVMLDVDKGRYFGVENVANTIWGAIAEPRTVGDVCATVLATYDADRADVEADTFAFLEQLIDAGLAVRHDEDG